MSQSLFFFAYVMPFLRERSWTIVASPMLDGTTGLLPVFIQWLLAAIEKFGDEREKQTNKYHDIGLVNMQHV
ncbi:hypothetical protein BJY00DRAFT_290468 [Aspergillus carlsbadensis]|nr:hypothetical protein BJY00DRAFT_290468 [Aspergillus carlsbadensis]